MNRGCGSELGKKEGQPDLGEGEPGRVSVETQKWPVLTHGRRMEACERDSPGQSFTVAWQLALLEDGDGGRSLWIVDSDHWSGNLRVPAGKLPGRGVGSRPTENRMGTDPSQQVLAHGGSR